MKHTRTDYQRRIVDLADEDPSLLEPGTTPIAADEPVMLFRAQDKHFVLVLAEYERQLRKDKNTRPDIIAAIRNHIDTVISWQVKNGMKTPDLPNEEA